MYVSRPLAVETGLEAITPAKYKRYAHHWLILHGRYVCQARKPDCPNCVVADLCRYGAKTGPAELIAARAGKGAPEAQLVEPIHLDLRDVRLASARRRHRARVPAHLRAERAVVELARYRGLRERLFAQLSPSTRSRS